MTILSTTYYLFSALTISVLIYSSVAIKGQIFLTFARSLLKKNIKKHLKNRSSQVGYF